MLDGLAVLPVCVMSHIMSYLTTKDHAYLAQVSQRYHRLTEISATSIINAVKSRHFHTRVFKTYLRPHKASNKQCLHLLLQSKVLIARGFVAYLFNPYDKQKIWTRCSDLRRDRSYFSLVWLKGEIYALGTYSVIASGTVERYNPISNIWTSIEPLPNKFRCFGSCVVNDLIYVIGGQDVYSNDTSSFIFTYKSSDDSSSRLSSGWKVHPTRAPQPKYGHSCTYYDGSIWIAGGYDHHNSCTKSVHIWNLSTNSWREGPSLKKKRKYFNIFQCSINNEVILFAAGGDETSTDNIDSSDKPTIEMYQKESNEWKIITTFPSNRVGYSSCAVSSNIYIFGGDLSPQNTWDCYDIVADTWLSEVNLKSKRDMPGLPCNGNAIVTPPTNLTW